MFVPTMLLQPYVMKHPSLLDLFISYKENEVMWILTQIPRQTTQEEEEKGQAQNKDKKSTINMKNNIQTKFDVCETKKCLFVFLFLLF